MNSGEEQRMRILAENGTYCGSFVPRQIQHDYRDMLAEIDRLRAELAAKEQRLADALVSNAQMERELAAKDAECKQRDEIIARQAEWIQAKETLAAALAKADDENKRLREYIDLVCDVLARLTVKCGYPLLEDMQPDATKLTRMKQLKAELFPAALNADGGKEGW